VLAGRGGGGREPLPAGLGKWRAGVGVPRKLVEGIRLRRHLSRRKPGSTILLCGRGRGTGSQSSVGGGDRERLGGRGGAGSADVRDLGRRFILVPGRLPEGQPRGDRNLRTCGKKFDRRLRGYWGSGALSWRRLARVRI